MKVNYTSTKAAFLKQSKALVVLAPEKFFKGKEGLLKFVPEEIHAILKNGSSDFKAGETGKVFSTLTSHSSLKKATYISLPQTVSRGNSPTRKIWAAKHLETALGSEATSLLISVDDKSHVSAMVSAIARFDRKVTYKTKDGKIKKEGSQTPSVNVLFVDAKGDVITASESDKKLTDSVAWCISLVDKAPSELNPGAFAKEVKARFSKVASVKITEISGKDLLKNKLGGIWAVGKAATSAPRLLALHYKPKGAKKTLALAGKGVTYDTGGLSLKISGSMVGMKTDMGGAAAVVSAFDHLVKSKSKHEVIAVLGLVENAIGPEATKPDDIIHMHSGLTVEVNNTDAEGRLVLGDCVSWVARKYSPSILIDAATLTGAQLVSTGMNHAAVVCNDDSLEEKAVKVGKQTGDLVCPLVFAPDILRSEFSSKIADMKNSVKNRMNAQTSCAANFIYSHIEGIKGLKWLHIDLAGPASNGDNLGTGYGVNLISELCK